MSSSDPNHHPVVLVADVEPLSRALAEKTLLDDGYQVIAVKNGDDALYAFRTHAPDCVVLELRLPRVDGLAVCRQIRALPQGDTIPILFVTALRNVESFDAAHDAGGDDFLMKPIHPPEFLGRVASALAQHAGAMGEHARWLRLHRDQLVRLQLQKERLTAFIVHDMKNPLNAVDLQVQLMLRLPDFEALRSSLERIRVETRQLERLVLELLDVAKSNEGGLQIERADIETGLLVQDVFAELELAARERGIELCVGTEIDGVRGDRSLLRRVLVNLIENAVRHAPVGTAIVVAAVRSDSEFEISVSDSGTGIPLELRERIFEPFFRAEAPEEGAVPYGGRGLGLAFCREVARAHGGNISVEDASPGALFRLRWIERSLAEP